MQPSDSSISVVFASVLRSGREHFNAQFAVARRQYGELDPESFKDYLRQVADPLVCAVHALAPEAVGSVAQASYEVGLELVGQRLYTNGPTQGHQLGANFAELLRAYAARVVEAPLPVLAALGNALHNLGATTGGDPARFTQEMLRLAQHVPDTATLLALGQIQAWRAGFAHFRRGALEQLQRLDHRLAALAMASNNTAGWTDERQQLSADPWFDPSIGRRAKPRWVGAFRGFGGLFTRPPRVTASQGQLLVISGDAHWLLLADAFGATFHRASDAELAAALPFSKQADVQIQGTTLLVRGEAALEQPRGAITSWVEVAGSLAISFESSHALLLYPEALEP